MAFCNSCQNITFEPVRGNLDRLEAVLQPDFSSLERSAKSRACSLCLAIHGMVRLDRQGVLDPKQKISLALQYEDEAEDAEFFFIDDEIGLNHGDSPPFLLIASPEMGLYFRIQNPDVISRSSLREATTAPTYDPGHTHPALEAVSSDASSGSDSSMALMRSWIKMCENDHQTCGKKASDSSFIYPKRLLDVSKIEEQSGSVFLVSSAQSNLNNTRPPYATLSHRWKPGHSCCTHSSTEQKYVHDGIPAGALTKTFREAAITTKKLGLRYLWIDSLCIVQNLDADKVEEIPKMADYYQNADLNIAEATESTNAGLFYQRDGEANRPLRLPVTINTPDLPVTTRKVVLELSPILRARASHLDTRGWILQERIFPRRTFFFDPYWVSFECAEMSASESCPRGVSKDSGTSSTQLESDMATIVSRDAALSTMGGFLRARYKEVSEGQKLDEAERAEVYRLWSTVLTEYCSRDLTMESDRLNAISALAMRLSQILPDEYVAGVWRNNLLECLWWGLSNEPMYHSPVRSKECGAPTWSWASLCYTSKAPRNNRRRFGFFEATSIIPRVQVRDLTRETLGPSQSSNVLKLILSGGLLRGYVYLRGKEDDYMDLVTVTEGLRSRPKSRQRRHLFDGTTNWRMHICAESSGQRDRVTVQVFPDVSDGMVEGYFYLLPVAESTGSGDWVPGKMPPKVEDGRLFGLVLQETTEGSFQRVGCVETKADLLMATNERDIVLV
ncbi:hypothetical protein CEP54_006758 [Fusarium duplospermum]|uniref:Heterokaryon incompatibility domain-containing protein n=1 Tax=Fusarium duplospermum TaxID=1325734 RepID=A0A428Q5A9_9HYPO|nr:hypothetical protein CEP54_006758 [Fusarium duplospermum]